MAVGRLEEVRDEEIEESFFTEMTASNTFVIATRCLQMRDNILERF